LTPVWANQKTVRLVTGVNDKILWGLVADGTVDMRKLGDKRQSTTLYRVKDVLDWIERQKTPKRETEAVCIDNAIAKLETASRRSRDADLDEIDGL
jgi:hypothetical protein